MIKISLINFLIFQALNKDFNGFQIHRLHQDVIIFWRKKYEFNLNKTVLALC